MCLFSVLLRFTDSDYPYGIFTRFAAVSIQLLRKGRPLWEHPKTPLALGRDIDNFLILVEWHVSCI
jgi:hypothetical protein